MERLIFCKEFTTNHTNHEQNRDWGSGTRSLSGFALFEKKMRKNAVFEHFIPCKLRKEPENRKILRLFAAKFYKSDRLLGTGFSFGSIA